MRKRRKVVKKKIYLKYQKQSNFETQKGDNILIESNQIKHKFQSDHKKNTRYSKVTHRL